MTLKRIKEREIHRLQEERKVLLSRIEAIHLRIITLQQSIGLSE